MFKRIVWATDGSEKSVDHRGIQPAHDIADAAWEAAE